jgi:hypothetical protein
MKKNQAGLQLPVVCLFLCAFVLCGFGPPFRFGPMILTDHDSVVANDAFDHAGLHLFRIGASDKAP